jgi:hypothetical protein
MAKGEAIPEEIRKACRIGIQFTTCFSSPKSYRKQYTINVRRDRRRLHKKEVAR